METTIHLVDRIPQLAKRKKVCAYARVSSDKDAMLHSLSAQVSYYSDMIQSRPGWEYAGVFADEAKTGTRDNRPGFQAMLSSCRAGNVDMVITKSISRFARNTVTLLETVRELKGLGVDVYFEEQNIHTQSADGELMLTILASYAQEESRSISENMKWRVRKNFSEGIPWNVVIIGYRFDGKKLVIHPEEAEIVRSIFNMYLSGYGYEAIAKILNEREIETRCGAEWTGTAVAVVLKNYIYTGNLLLQATFRKDAIRKMPTPNRGEKAMYHAEHMHEPIIDISTFNTVQAEIQRRSEMYRASHKPHTVYDFTGKIACGICGKNYRRKTLSSGFAWSCTTYEKHGKSTCPAKRIPEQILYDIISQYGSVEDIKKIIALPENTIRLIFTDGRELTEHWQDRSRSESWTPEMRAAARQKEIERRAKCQK